MGAGTLTTGVDGTCRYLRSATTRMRATGEGGDNEGEGGGE